MTKQELIDRVYRKHGISKNLTKKAVGEIIDGTFAELGDYFIKTKISRNHSPRFTYPGFGTFAKKRRNARTGRHPQSGAAIEIPATNTVLFTVGSTLKDLLNRE
jgi:nucleoid DNA-binding protein